MKSNSPLENYKVIFRRSTPKGGGGLHVQSTGKRSDMQYPGVEGVSPKPPVLQSTHMRLADAKQSYSMNALHLHHSRPSDGLVRGRLIPFPGVSLRSPPGYYSRFAFSCFARHLIHGGVIFPFRG